MVNDAKTINTNIDQLVAAYNENPQGKYLIFRSEQLTRRYERSEQYENR
jgi:hypothetical protein